MTDADFEIRFSEFVASLDANQVSTPPEFAELIATEFWRLVAGDSTL